MNVLGQLGGREGVDELRRWVSSRETSPELRCHAALALATAKDEASIGIVAALLDELPPCVDVMRALALLHATGEASHIATTLLSAGPEAPAAFPGSMSEENAIVAGLHALGDLDTDEAWDQFYRLGRSPNAGWRRLALATYARVDPLPRPVAVLAAERLDDDDPDVRQAACWTVMGTLMAKPRYPYACSNPATNRDRMIDVARDAVAGRSRPNWLGGPLGVAPALGGGLRGGGAPRNYVPPSPTSPRLPTLLPSPVPGACARKEPTVIDVCHRLENVGVASHCAVRSNAAVFAPPTATAPVPVGRAPGMVLRGNDDNQFLMMLRFEGGAPRFVSLRACLIVYVAKSQGFPADAESKAKALVDELDQPAGGPP
jgi:hypothetical protein